MAEEQDKNPQTSETQAPEKDAGLGAEESGSEEKKSEKIDPKETAESKEAANDKEKAPKSAEDEPEKESEETEGKPDAEEAPGKPEEASEAEILTKKLKDSEDRYVHLMADFQNYKRRVEKEKADVYSFANEKMMTSLLQVMDNFERAVDQECSDEAYQKGMELIFKQLKELMEKEGLEEIE
ncbi:MAG: nucleotide exchange factor GrpE, partial [Eubacteriales bacterium]|nr:nucleotide exchange factor GrpE [Eubacteriales bacterium]